MEGRPNRRNKAAFSNFPSVSMDEARVASIFVVINKLMLHVPL